VNIGGGRGSAPRKPLRALKDRFVRGIVASGYGFSRRGAAPEGAFQLHLNGIDKAVP